MPTTEFVAPSILNRAEAVVLTLALILATLAFAFVNSGPAGAAEGDGLVRTVTYEGRTLTLRLQKVTVRSADYKVLAEQSDGSYKSYTPAAERAYLGSVDGDPGATASGIIASDGVFLGRVTFDRGETWDVEGTSVTGTRGSSAPAGYAWPSSADDALNRSTAPGQVGTTTYGWELGYDVDYPWFNSAPVSGSLAKAVDQVDLSMVSMLDVYESNALLQPSVRRLLIHGAIAEAPVPDQTKDQKLTAVRAGWRKAFSDTVLDLVVRLSADNPEAGFAWLSMAGATDWAYALSGGPGASITVQRHELGHTWGVVDNHTNGPEGATIQSGNRYQRFDGTELSAIIRHRDALLSQSVSPLPSLGRFAVPLPPYAALDLVDRVNGTVATRPGANDHDANGDALALESVQSTSHLGGRLTRSGEVVAYTPPEVTAASVDWATYVIKDSSGKTATGVMIFRIDPTDSTPSEEWPSRSPRPNTFGYLLTNRASGLEATISVAAATRQDLVQRSATDAAARWAFTVTPSGLQVADSATGMCLGVAHGSKEPGAPVVHNTCNNQRDQRWRVAVRPAGGTAIVNANSGHCLTVQDRAVASGATLVQESCGRWSSQEWDVRLPPMSTWPQGAAPSGSQELVNARSGLRAGTAAGAGLDSRIVQRSRAAQTPLALAAGADGIWRLRQDVSGNCWNDEANVHRYVVLWTCSAPTSGFQVLQHPWGGVVVVGAASRCVGIEKESSAADASLYLTPCSESQEDQRWLVRPVDR